MRGYLFAARLKTLWCAGFLFSARTNISVPRFIFFYMPKDISGRGFRSRVRRNTSGARIYFSSAPKNIRCADLFHKCAETFVIVSEGGEPTSRAYLIDLINPWRSSAGYAVHCLACTPTLRTTARVVRSFSCSRRGPSRISN